MKVKFNRWYNAILTALLTMLGYGCSSEGPLDMYGSPVVEYGTPYADYQLHGTVTDETGSPVKDIKVSTKYVFHNYDGTVVTDGIDSIQTDGLGKYAVGYRRYHGENDLKLIVEDVDGDANGGVFKSDTIDIDYKNATKVKDAGRDEHWSEGTYAIKQDIILKKK
ncbi:MAG: radical SAM-associated putative lipoprotein [Prevotella sp.]|nr:radical SAM-associated putative lipoprotein [Prevotella sp.]